MGATVEKSRNHQSNPSACAQLAALPAEKIWRTKGLYSVTFDDGVTVEMPARYIKLELALLGSNTLLQRRANSQHVSIESRRASFR